MTRINRIAVSLCLAFLCLAFFACASNAQEVDQRLAAGEFAAAISGIDQIPATERDPILAQIAAAQGSIGETIASGRTIRGIDSASSRSDAVQSPSDAAGAGGGSFADFQSLIDLIQTTIVPDTWEALGGPSTMAPYPQGIYVDASGTVRECETFASGDAIEDLKSLLSRPDDPSMDQPQAWRRPSKMRCVSLRRLIDRLTDAQIQGRQQSEAMVHLAGLSQVQYLLIEEDDIVLAGPVGGIDSHRGWFRDRETGLHPIRLEHLQTCMQSAIRNQPFGCTIDPTNEGLRRAAEVAAGVQSDRIPIGKAAEQMVAALGMQRVEVFGTAGDTPIGYLMVEADRHMKELALGIEPMPRGAKNYLDFIDEHIENGAPNDLLLRLWFTTNPISVRADPNRQVFEMAGTPIRLSGQNERAMASGQRGNVTRDIRSEAFVAEFNRNWHNIRTEYPLYGALESVYWAACTAELIRRHAAGEQHSALISALGTESHSAFLMPTPRRVESIATLHSLQRGRTRHHVLLASGGVAVASRQSLGSAVKLYASLTRTKTADARPRAAHHWWWD